MADADLQTHLVPADVCLVGFASMGDDCGGGLTPLEWGRTFEALGVAYVLMRDRHLCWYQRGVEGVGDINAVASYVRALRSSYRRVIATGISMGGYAALMFGALGNTTEIVALSPQTRLFDDDRWDRHFEAYVHPVMTHRSLAPLLAEYTGRARIFVGGSDPCIDRDMMHAGGVKAESVTIIQEADHSSVGTWLRDSGFFRHLVQ